MKGNIIIFCFKTTYSPVVMFLHRLPGQLADFHRIQTESGQTIELTGDHLIYVTDCKLNNAIDMQIIPAKNVKVGDCLRTTAENSNGVELRTSRVVNITMVGGEGGKMGRRGRGQCNNSSCHYL